MNNIMNMDFRKHAFTKRWYGLVIQNRDLHCGTNISKNHFHQVLTTFHILFSLMNNFIVGCWFNKTQNSLKFVQLHVFAELTPCINVANNWKMSVPNQEYGSCWSLFLWLITFGFFSFKLLWISLFLSPEFLL